MSALTVNLAITAGVDFGPVVITCYDALGAVLPLAGWKAYSEARSRTRGKPDGAAIIDFAPVIASDDAAGVVTVPALTYAQTADLPAGTYYWDLVLENPSGVRLEPPVVGSVVITRINTQKP